MKHHPNCDGNCEPFTIHHSHCLVWTEAEQHWRESERKAVLKYLSELSVEQISDDWGRGVSWACDAAEEAISRGDHLKITKKTP